MTTAHADSPVGVSERPEQVDTIRRDDASVPRHKPDPLTLVAQAARYRECNTGARIASRRAEQTEIEMTEHNEAERSAAHHSNQWSRMLIGSMVDSFVDGIPSVGRWYQREIPLASFEADGVTVILVADPFAEPPESRRELIERTRILLLGERPLPDVGQVEQLSANLQKAGDQPPTPDAGSLSADLQKAMPEPPGLHVDDYLRECCGAALRAFAAIRPRWEKGRDWINRGEGHDDPPPPGRRSTYDTWDFLERLYGLAEQAAAYACLATDPAMPNPRDWSSGFNVEDLPARTVRFEGRHFIGGGLIEGTDRSKRLACVMTEADRTAPDFIEPETFEGAELEPDAPVDCGGKPDEQDEARGLAVAMLRRAAARLDEARDTLDVAWRRAKEGKDWKDLHARAEQDAIAQEAVLADVICGFMPDRSHDSVSESHATNPFGIAIGDRGYIVVNENIGTPDEPGLRLVVVDRNRVLDLG